MPLFVGREASIKAIEAAQKFYRRHIFLVAQKESTHDKPKASELCAVGVVSKVLQVLRLPDGTIKVLFEGLRRAITTWRLSMPTTAMFSPSQSSSVSAR